MRPSRPERLVGEPTISRFGEAIGSGAIWRAIAISSRAVEHAARRRRSRSIG